MQKNTFKTAHVQTVTTQNFTRGDSNSRVVWNGTALTPYKPSLQPLEVRTVKLLQKAEQKQNRTTVKKFIVVFQTELEKDGFGFGLYRAYQNETFKKSLFDAYNYSRVMDYEKLVTTGRPLAVQLFMPTKHLLSGAKPLPFQSKQEFYQPLTATVPDYKTLRDRPKSIIFEQNSICLIFEKEEETNRDQAASASTRLQKGEKEEEQLMYPVDDEECLTQSIQQQRNENHVSNDPDEGITEVLDDESTLEATLPRSSHQPGDLNRCVCVNCVVS